MYRRRSKHPGRLLNRWLDAFPLAPALLATLYLTLLLGAASHAAELAKFEPAEGCYIGAFIDLDFNLTDRRVPPTEQRKIEDFEALTHKKHASYFTYVGYGQPFPRAWVEEIKAEHAAPQIAFEPNNGLDEVEDDEYLRCWARDAARANCPIFLRWASEMNGSWTVYGKNPAQYREKFRLVSQVMKEEAPNVAMVWTPFAEPQNLIAEYYPGDQWVDWVGVNIYSVYVNNGDPRFPAYQKDPVEYLRFIYDNYAARKPIHISEFAATIFCKGTSTDTVSFAIDKMEHFYGAIRDEFPRVKAVNWFCWDTIRANRANNNYSLLDDGRVLAAYRKIVADPHFLSDVPFDASTFKINVPPGTTLGPQGIVLRPPKNLDEQVTAGSGAVVVGLQDPSIIGLKDGQIVTGDLEIEAQLPTQLVPQGVIWHLDGRPVALSNSAPFRFEISRERLGAGVHKVKVVVIAKDATHSEKASREVRFNVEQ
jgi:hypothetical protein